jgi:hypothetical protein
MFFKSIVTSVLLFGLVSPTNSFSQSHSRSISRVLDHNYKNPGTSMSNVKGGHVVKVYTHSVISRSVRSERGRNHATPKYANQPVALVIYARTRKEKPGINPLISARHYKAAAGSGLTSQQSSWVSENI